MPPTTIEGSWLPVEILPIKRSVVSTKKFNTVKKAEHTISKSIKGWTEKSWQIVCGILLNQAVFRPEKKNNVFEVWVYHVNLPIQLQSNKQVPVLKQGRQSHLVGQQYRYICCCTSSKWSWWCWRRRWGCRHGYRCDHRTVQRIDSRLPRNGHNAEIELVFIKWITIFHGQKIKFIFPSPNPHSNKLDTKKSIWVMLRFWFKNLSAVNKSVPGCYL